MPVPPEDEKQGDVRWLSWQLGRIEEIVRDSRISTDRALERFDRLLAENAKSVSTLESTTRDLERRVTAQEKQDEGSGGAAGPLVRIALAAFGVVGTALGVIVAIGGGHA